MTPRESLDELARAGEGGDSERFRRLLWERAEELRRYLLGFRLNGSDEGLTGAYVGDAFRRFLHTLELVELPAPPRILEIGANPYFFHLLLRRLFPSATVTATNFFDHDVFSRHVGSATQRIENEAVGERYEFRSVLFNLETLPEYPFEEASFDLVFFCETLEHLIVDPLAVFGRLHRVLAPGGRLVITLPNAVRLSNVGLMLAGCNFFDLYRKDNGIHGRHNREFTLEEVAALLGRNGFVVEVAGTADRYDYETAPVETVDYTGTRVALPWSRSDLLRMLERIGARLDNRGDNLYVRARRPRRGEPVSPDAGRVAPRVPVRRPTWPERLRGVRPAGPAARPAVDLEASEYPVESFIDLFEQREDAVEIAGWCFLHAERSSAAGGRVTLVLESESESRLWPTDSNHRPDVADRKDLDRSDVGFRAVVPLAALAPGRYRVSLHVASIRGPVAYAPTKYSFLVGGADGPLRGGSGA